MKPNQWIDRPVARRCGWLVVAPFLACILRTPAVLAAEAQGIEESVPNATVQRPDDQQLEVMVGQAYPQLLVQRFGGIAVVTVLLNRDGTLAATDLEVFGHAPGELTVSELNFTRFGLKAADLTYMGITRFELPLNAVLVVYGGKRQ